MIGAEDKGGGGFVRDKDALVRQSANELVRTLLRNDSGLDPVMRVRLGTYQYNSSRANR